MPGREGRHSGPGEARARMDRDTEQLESIVLRIIRMITLILIATIAIVLCLIFLTYVGLWLWVFVEPEIIPF